MGRRTLDLVKHVKFLAQAGAIEKPKWLDVVARIPPAEPAKSGKKPQIIRFPEDDLLQAYYAKHPEAKLEPIDLKSFEPPTARKFVWRQLELMDEGLPRRDAFDQVEREMSLAVEESQEQAFGVQLLGQIQREEEEHLIEAMVEFRDRHPLAGTLTPGKPPKLPRRASGPKPHTRGASKSAEPTTGKPEAKLDDASTVKPEK